MLDTVVAKDNCKVASEMYPTVRQAGVGCVVFHGLEIHRPALPLNREDIKGH